MKPYPNRNRRQSIDNFRGDPPALANADYSTIDRFLEGFLVSRCGTEAIYVHWIGGEQLKYCNTHGNLSCVGLHFSFKFKFLPKMTEHQMKCSLIYSQCLLPPFSFSCLWIMMVLWWYPYPTVRKVTLGLLTEWISGGDTAAFNSHIINSSVGAPLTTDE